MSVGLASLRAELRSAGIFDHRELRSLLKLVCMLAALGATLTAIALTSWLCALVLVPIAAVLCTSLAMYGHEGSHRSFSSSPARNALLLHLMFPLFSGLGSLYWREKHDRLHHGHPNVEGVDPDIRPFPFVSSRRDHEQSSPGERWFQRNFQRWVFWPMSTLMAIGMRRSSILYAIRYPRSKGMTRAWWLEVSCMAVHYIAWLVIPSLVWGPLTTFALYFAVWGLVGVCLALVFAPAHIGLPIVSEQNHDWRHQLETTRNLELPRVASFFFIGLDYQVEHHLFPTIPHANLRKAAAITKQWCEKHAIPYQSMPYLDALQDAARFIRDAWKRESMSAADLRATLAVTLASSES